MSDFTTKPRVAIAFAYDGTMFDSFARQPGRRTVEGELLDSLRRVGAIASARAARYEVASRTDKDVSAWWNVCALDTSMDPRALIHRARPAPGLLLLAAALAHEDFSPRRMATGRTYVYRVDGLSAAQFRRAAKAARRFEGRHDFAAFARREPGQATLRRVEKVGAAWRKDAGELRFHAQSFLWEQVRRMVHGALDVGMGLRTIADLEDQLKAADRRRAEPPAAPQPLTLARVDVPVEWRFPNRDALDLIRRSRSEARTRLRFYEGLEASVPTARRKWKR